ncbi:DUF2249 domain-containing protein [Moritella sp. F3]|uniref:DUF2249 domain-containing protein n=1 Tax=Moritella sp. F3 TaxID=2718882 RepID=UPI0018E106ED|nr:DUF2249 domain-containing protein [Moritella sp. F3]GIC78192.1 hypothetical protein FMO001_29190 [Moritella sp. F1]GIC81164.1 hypothetical protein FMO003_14450 [Moritella sp. F3]
MAITLLPTNVLPTDVESIGVPSTQIPPTKLQVIKLDVSEFPMPEPMRQVLQALAELSPGQCLIIYHRKNPVPLYPKLVELGFVYRVDIDYGFSQSSALVSHQGYDNGSCEDLAVIIKVAFKADASALAAFSELELE